MMTRKDYVATAQILNKFADRIDSHEFNDLVFEFGEMFLADNQRFVVEKFEQACYEIGMTKLQQSTRYNPNL
jgi:hypothetical protein